MSYDCHSWLHFLCLHVIPPVWLLGDTGSLLWLTGWSISLLVSVSLDGLWDFLFLMRILPISSWGLGRGTPCSSWKQTRQQHYNPWLLVTRSLKGFFFFLQGICPEDQLGVRLQKWFDNIQPFLPVASSWKINTQLNNKLECVCWGLSDFTEISGLTFIWIVEVKPSKTKI